jgi:hypothetical protein
MAGASTGKANQINKAKAIAGRLAYLRSGTFKLEGFGYHDKPTVSEARAMAERNKRMLVGDGKPYGWKTPSVTQ